MTDMLTESEVAALDKAEETSRNRHILDNKALRLKIKEALECLAVAQAARNSRERSVCKTKLQEASMWLGQDLRELADGAPGPYAKTDDATTTHVDEPEPEAPVRLEGAKAAP